MTKTKKGSSFLTYKGKPLVRSGNTIYYGNMNEEYVVIINITGTRTVHGLEIADRVIVQLVSNDESLRLKDRIINKAEQRGLYNAMDIGSVWLERKLEK